MIEQLLVDQRASATGTLNFFLAIGAGAILAWIMSKVAEPVIEHGETAAQGDPTGTTAMNYASAFVDYWPVLILFTSFFAYLALAVFERELGY